MTWRNNVKVGTATAVLTGIGDYFGMKEITFVIENHKWDGPMKTVQEATALAYGSQGENLHTVRQKRNKSAGQIASDHVCKCIEYCLEKRSEYDKTESDRTCKRRQNRIMDFQQQEDCERKFFRKD